MLKCRDAEPQVKFNRISPKIEAILILIASMNATERTKYGRGISLQ